MASDIVIRDARPQDNEALIELDRQCVMGGTIQLVFDRSPDFFARSRAYESFRMCVAEQEGTLIGVGGVTVKSLRVNGIRHRWAYFYDLRVHPSHRRRGIAGLIANALVDGIRDAGITSAYSLVIEGNAPSESFVEMRGSLPFKRCALALLSGEAGASRLERIPDVGSEVASLLEATYRSYHFTPPWDPETLHGTLDRLTPLGWEGMYGRRAEKGWGCCFGLWDYSSVMQMTFRGRGAEMHTRPFFLYPFGWQDPQWLLDGLRAAQAVIASGGTLLLPYVPGDPVSAVIPQDAFRVGMTLYVRGPAPKEVQTDGFVFIDPADL
ncbi:MAG: GNAT family N-acetyltransferase [Candidatus Methylomirabilales bacterium]